MASNKWWQNYRPGDARRAARDVVNEFKSELKPMVDYARKIGDAISPDPMSPLGRYLDSEAHRAGIREVKWLFGFREPRIATRTLADQINKQATFRPMAGGLPKTNFVKVSESAVWGELSESEAKLVGLKMTPRGVIGDLAGRAFGIGMVALAAYEGYQEGGVWGATKGVAKETAFWYAWGVVAEATAGFLTGPLAVLAATYAGAKVYDWAMDKGAKFYKEHTRLEMGMPNIDPFGTSATMRMRALNAIQNSHINGRTALGNEAQLFHRRW